MVDTKLLLCYHASMKASLESIKWTGLFLLVIGASLNAINIYPLNSLFLVAGGLAWAWVGYKQKDTPLILTNLLINAPYVIVFLYKLTIGV